LPHVDDLVGDLLLDDQLVFHIDRDLGVLAHGSPNMGRHRAAVGTVNEICRLARKVAGLADVPRGDRAN
jgi:hypothetical protein